jgi:hypothetical protein
VYLQGDTSLPLFSRQEKSRRTAAARSVSFCLKYAYLSCCSAVRGPLPQIKGFGVSPFTGSKRTARRRARWRR